jgi:hypothetical protein
MEILYSSPLVQLNFTIKSNSNSTIVGNIKYTKFEKRYPYVYQTLTSDCKIFCHFPLPLSLINVQPIIVHDFSRLEPITERLTLTLIFKQLSEIKFFYFVG